MMLNDDDVKSGGVFKNLLIKYENLFAIEIR